MFSKSVRTAFVALTALAVSISATQSLSIKVNGISHVSLPTICMFIFSPGPPAVDSVEHLKIVATITNTGDETLKVLNDPRGPLNKLPTDTFVITDAKGAQPSFTGIKLKYVPKTAATLGAYTILAPGKSVAVEHDRRYLLRSSFLVCRSRYTHLSIQSLMRTTLLYLEQRVTISTQKISSTLSTLTPRYRLSTPMLIRIPQRFLGSWQ